jgi:hypothetical protein
VGGLLFGESGNVGEVVDVEDYTGRLLGAVLCNKGVEAGGAAADSCYFDALADEVVGHCCADAGGCADDEDVLVWEGHCGDFPELSMVTQAMRNDSSLCCTERRREMWVDRG